MFQMIKCNDNRIGGVQIKRFAATQFNPNSILNPLVGILEPHQSFGNEEYELYIYIVLYFKLRARTAEYI